jgi:hypothetical protein
LKILKTSKRMAYKNSYKKKMQNGNVRNVGKRYAAITDYVLIVI